LPHKPVPVYGWTGQRHDAETGLQYFGARYYDAKIGRFISQDPMMAGSNPYSYPNNDPLNLIDPTGMYGVGFMDGLGGGSSSNQSGVRAFSVDDFLNSGAATSNSSFFSAGHEPFGLIFSGNYGIASLTSDYYSSTSRFMGGIDSEAARANRSAFPRPDDPVTGGYRSSQDARFVSGMTTPGANFAYTTILNPRKDGLYYPADVQYVHEGVPKSGYDHAKSVVTSIPDMPRAAKDGITWGVTTVADGVAMGAAHATDGRYGSYRPLTSESYFARADAVGEFEASVEAFNHSFTLAARGGIDHSLQAASLG
jgi:RHS repeat-associated protein